MRIREALLGVWATAAVCASGIAHVPPSERAAADAAATATALRGHALVEARCLGCHAESGALALSPAGTAPGFVDIARRYRDTGGVRDALGDRHMPMPRFGLRDDQLDHIAVYIRTLEDS